MWFEDPLLIDSDDAFGVTFDTSIECFTKATNAQG